MSLIVGILAFIIAITIHEASHAWMSDKLGDPTAKLMGRLTLNPIAHMDLYGTILIPLVLILTRSPFVFGWAKPVQFDPYNLKNPRKDSALISLAGPVSNLLLAVSASLILRLTDLFVGNFYLWTVFLVSLITVNVTLAIFNFIPIHPLDGGKIFVGLLPEKDARDADLFLQRYGTLILIFLIFPSFNGVSPISMVITPIISLIVNILVPGSSFI